MVKRKNTRESTSRQRSTHAIRRMSWLYTCCVFSFIKKKRKADTIDPYFQLHIYIKFFSLSSAHNNHASASFSRLLKGNFCNVEKSNEHKEKTTHVTLTMSMMMMVMMFSTRFRPRCTSWWQWRHSRYSNRFIRRVSILQVVVVLSM